MFIFAPSLSQPTRGRRIIILNAMNERITEGQATVLNPVQLHLLRMFSYMKSEAQLKEFNHDYKYICLDYDYNYNYDFLDSIPQNERDRVEILINSTCPKGCSTRVLHQAFSAKRQLEYNGDDDCESEEFYRDCPKIKRIMQSSTSQDDTTNDIHFETNYIFPQDMDNYLDKGYSHFKIQGRELAVSQILAEFMPYLIRPDFYPIAISLINSK